MMPRVSAARYGKDNVRVYKVDRDEKSGTQSVTEMTVCVLLEGDIEESFTKADNSVVVPTDTMKQTTYIMAKQHPVNPPELFGAILASHFLDKYAWITTAHVKIIQHRWSRMVLDGQPHPHSFWRDGAETRNAEVAAKRGSGIEVNSAIAGLLVLKSTGSAFHGYHQDEYTILPPTNDRILSTEVDSTWTWRNFADVAAVQKMGDSFDTTWTKARDITMKVFATENSPSVQNTMYKMCEQILAAQDTVQSVSYSLPNKHYFEIDLSWHNGLKNTGKDAEVYAPQTNPNGLIKCTVSR